VTETSVDKACEGWWEARDNGAFQSQSIWTSVKEKGKGGWSRQVSDFRMILAKLQSGR
jgi:hypothetical protein